MLRPILTVSWAPARPTANGASAATATAAIIDLRSNGPSLVQTGRRTARMMLVVAAKPRPSATTVVRPGAARKPLGAAAARTGGRSPKKRSARRELGLEQVERRGRERLHVGAAVGAAGLERDRP